jgi:hypothetical protein
VSASERLGGAQFRLRLPRDGQHETTITDIAEAKRG